MAACVGMNTVIFVIQEFVGENRSSTPCLSKSTIHASSYRWEMHHFRKQSHGVAHSNNHCLLDLSPVSHGNWPSTPPSLSFDLHSAALTGECSSQMTLHFAMCHKHLVWPAKHTTASHCDHALFHHQTNRCELPQQMQPYRYLRQKERKKDDSTLPPAWTMVLLHFQVGLTLYVNLNWALWELEGPWRILPPLQNEHLE